MILSLLYRGVSSGGDNFVMYLKFYILQNNFKMYIIIII